MTDRRIIFGELARDDGGSEQVVALVEPPVSEAGAGHYFCRVCIPRLFDSEKRIVGIDAAQASQLAVEFVELIFEGHGIRIVWRSPA